MGGIERAALAAAGLILSFQLFVPPVIGLADNGDFNRVIRRYDLSAPTFDDEAHFIVTKLRIDPKFHWESSEFSSERFLVRAAMVLNRAISKPGEFDLRMIGVVHAVLFLLALALLAPVLRDAAPWRRALIYFVIVAVFCDVMYVSWLNSFFMDVPAYLFLLLTVVLYLRVARLDRRHWIEYVAMIGCASLFASSKGQHTLLALPIAAAFALTLRPMWARIAAPLSVLLVVGANLVAMPQYYRATPFFTVVFNVLLPGSPTPSEDLRALGLDDSYARYTGMFAYSPNSPLLDQKFEHDFARRVTPFRIAMFYARHPGRTIRQLGAGLNKAAEQRPIGLGNFGRETGRPPGSKSYAFAAWSQLKQHAFRNRGWIYLGWLLILIGIALFRAYRNNLLLAACLVFAAMTAGALAIGALGDNLETERHLFIYNAMVDVWFIGVIASLLYKRPLPAQTP